MYILFATIVETYALEASTINREIGRLWDAGQVRLLIVRRIDLGDMGVVTGAILGEVSGEQELLMMEGYHLNYVLRKYF